jgi:hypothetical protein
MCVGSWNVNAGVSAVGELCERTFVVGLFDA